MNHKHYRVATLLTAALALGSSTRMRGADWPSFRGPTHDGKSAEAIAWPKEGPKQLWTINVAAASIKGSWWAGR